MQNPNVKYLKMPNGNFYLFYHENNTLFLQVYAGATQTQPVALANRAAPCFSVCRYAEICYVLYSTLEGNLFIASSSGHTGWDHRPVMLEASHAGKTKFFLLPTEDSFHMIYHQPTESTGIDSLVYTAFKNGQWEKPYQIDRFMPFGKTPYLARRLSRDHIILYYRTGRATWSAREMLLSPYTMGSLTPMLQLPASCIDISIVNDAERIHVLYVVRGMFRTQVVYQYKQTTAISAPRVLWEDANCDNCLAYLENSRLILMWTLNGQPMRCISENNGASFGAVERYTGNFPAQCTKAELLGAEDAALNAAETYGDMSRNYAPFLFTSPSMQKPPASDPAPLPFRQEAYRAAGSFAEMQPRTMRQTAEIPPQENYKQQIEELTALLAQRSDEITAVNARWMGQVSRLEQELAELRREHQQLLHRHTAPPQPQQLPQTTTYPAQAELPSDAPISFEAQEKNAETTVDSD